MKCGRCKNSIETGKEEYCWYCMGFLCYECWEEFGMCDHPKVLKKLEEIEKRWINRVTEGGWDEKRNKAIHK